MADLATVEKLLEDVAKRIEAMPMALTEEATKSLIKSILAEELAEDGEFARKMRFSQSPATLVGTKFSRWSLDVADVEFLYDLTTSAREAGRGRGPSEDLQNAFKALSEAHYLSADEVQKIDRQAIDGLFPRVTRANAKAFDAALKAMDSAESGFGSQLVGAQYVGDLWTAAERQSRVFSLIDSFEMTHPTAYLPVEVDIPEMLFVSENTANNSSDYTTVKTGSQRVQVDAKKFVIHQMWSGELEEDSLIPFVPFLRRQAALGIAHYSDSLILNGDNTNAATGNINLDDADPADTKHYLAFDGVRHVGLVDNTNNQKDANGAPTVELLLGQRGRMRDTTNLVDWGHPTNPQDLVYVADPATGDAIAAIANVLTVDKYGSNATILTGEVANVGRHPLIVSQAMALTQADGKPNAASNTKGQVVAFNRRGFKVGWRRRVKLEVERLPGRDQNRLVYSLRMGFGRFSPTGAASGIEAADVLYNITV